MQSRRHIYLGLLHLRQHSNFSSQPNQLFRQIQGLHGLGQKEHLDKSRRFQLDQLHINMRRIERDFFYWEYYFNCIEDMWQLSHRTSNSFESIGLRSEEVLLRRRHY